MESSRFKALLTLSIFTQIVQLILSGSDTFSVGGLNMNFLP